MFSKIMHSYDSHVTLEKKGIFKVEIQTFFLKLQRYIKFQNMDTPLVLQYYIDET